MKTAIQQKEKGYDKITHIICYSGGHSSAKVAMNVHKQFPNDSIILLNHDISKTVEHQDIKRFKQDVSNYLNIPITYANYEGIINPDDIPDQFDVCIKIKGFKFGNGTELCTYNLKTKPFYNFLATNFPPDKDTGVREDVVIYYGFDANEMHRVQRRSGILGAQGYYTDYPLALWDNVDNNIVENAGIIPPLTYKQLDTDYDSYGSWKHGNCVGCLKAGKQHWYVTYCVRPDIFKKAMETEDKLDHSIIKGIYLDELEPLFEEMKLKGIPPTEHIKGPTFWANVRKVINKNKDVLEVFEMSKDSEKPCECTI